jgi:hypothetical protein
MCEFNKNPLKTSLKNTNDYYYKEYIFEANVIDPINYDKRNIKQ